MTAFSCRECRALLPAYVDRELSAAARRLVAVHLDHCERCHAAWVRQRHLTGGLRAGLPGVGRLEPARAGALWQAVHRELSASRRIPLPFSQRGMSALVLLIAAALVLPWLLSPGRLAARSLPLPPTPASVDAQATDTPPSISRAFTAQHALPVTPPAAPEYAPTQAVITTLFPIPFALDGLPLTHAGAIGAP